ncbi:hypothetical protein ACLB2K_054366 [Fragaria x ananassa]
MFHFRLVKVSGRHLQPSPLCSIYQARVSSPSWLASNGIATAAWTISSSNCRLVVEVTGIGTMVGPVNSGAGIFRTVVVSTKSAPDLSVFTVVTSVDDRKYVLGGGPWFYDRSLFVLALYDGLRDVPQVSISSFPVWIEILGLPPALKTEEAT